MATLNFPDSIMVILGTHFDSAGYIGMSSGDTIILQKGTGSHKTVRDPDFYILNPGGSYTVPNNTVTFWSEDGTLTPSATNRLLFIPMSGQVSDYLTAYMATNQKVDLNVSRMRRAHIQGYYSDTVYGPGWQQDPLIVHKCPGIQTDYSFLDLWSHSPNSAIRPEANKNLYFEWMLSGGMPINKTLTVASSGTDWFGSTTAGCTFLVKKSADMPYAGTYYNPQIFQFMGSATVTADFTSDVTSGGADLTVNFTDQSSGSITTWLWDFGDGNISTDQNPSHTYTVSGEYDVSLTVDGGTDTETKTDYITVDVSSSYTVQLKGEEDGLSVQFTDTSKGRPNDWGWDFGDGHGATGIQNPTHTYDNGDSYIVKQTAFRTG